MKRLFRRYQDFVWPNKWWWPLLGLLCLFAMVSPASAQTATAVTAAAADPWHHGTNEYIANANYGKQADGHYRGLGSFAWARFISDNTEIGTVVSFRDVLTKALTPGGPTATVQGSAAGAWYEYNFPFGAKAKGHWFVGGDAQYVAGGDLKDLTTYVYSTWAGRKWHVGKTGAVRASFDWERAGQQGSGAAINQAGVNFGFSIGSGKT